MSNPPAVLFDAPGPKTRRNVRIGTIVALVAVAVLAVVVIIRFANRGQLDWELWGPLLDPRTEEFGLVWPRLLSGLVVTLQAAIVAMTAITRNRWGRTTKIGSVCTRRDN